MNTLKENTEIKLSENAKKVLEKRYLKRDIKGNVTETPKELFDIQFIRWWIDWLGAFAVNRESLGPSTAKNLSNARRAVKRCCKKWKYWINPWRSARICT